MSAHERTHAQAHRKHDHRRSTVWARLGVGLLAVTILVIILDLSHGAKGGLEQGHSLFATGPMIPYEIHWRHFSRNPGTSDWSIHPTTLAFGGHIDVGSRRLHFSIRGQKFGNSVKEPDPDGSPAVRKTISFRAACDGDSTYVVDVDLSQHFGTSAVSAFADSKLGRTAVPGRVFTKNQSILISLRRLEPGAGWVTVGSEFRFL